MTIRQWSTTASGNASAASINWAEGQAPSTVNNSARELMAQIRQEYDPERWGWIAFSATVSVASQTTFKITGNQTDDYVANRKVKLTGGTATVYADILSASYTSETTVTIQNASGSLSSSMSIAWLSAVYENNLPGVILLGDLGLANCRLYVNDGATTGRAININSSDGNGAAVIGTNGGAGTTNGLVIDAYRGGGSIDLKVGGTSRLLIDASGNVTIANALSVGYFQNYAEAVNAIGSTGGGTQDIDLTLGNVVTATVDTSANTFTFSNPSASGRACSFTLILTNGGSQTVNWPASVVWQGGDAPTLTASGVDIIEFLTVNGGTTWYGFAAGLDMS